MDDIEFERLAAATRERMLRIWDGDAKRADEFLCDLMRHYRDVSKSYGISPKSRDRVLKKMATLIQR